MLLLQAYTYSRLIDCRLLCAQLPPAFRFSGTDVQAAGLWGMTAAVGAVWLVRHLLEH